MKVLLDTHAFLWAIGDEKRLSPKVSRLLLSAEAWWSVASVWEVLAKVAIGKLLLPQPTGAYLTRKLETNGVRVLPVSLSHVLRIESLPLHHRDPFDRLLIAQSIEEGWPIVTADPWFQRYPVEIIW
jgi:PIN domain nuclease of toxin-antitoxin system